MCTVISLMVLSSQTKSNRPSSTLLIPKITQTKLKHNFIGHPLMITILAKNEFSDRYQRSRWNTCQRTKRPETSGNLIIYGVRSYMFCYAGWNFEHLNEFVWFKRVFIGSVHVNNYGTLLLNYTNLYASFKEALCTLEVYLEPHDLFL